MIEKCMYSQNVLTCFDSERERFREKEKNEFQKPLGHTLDRFTRCSICDTLRIIIDYSNINSCLF